MHCTTWPMTAVRDPYRISCRYAMPSNPRTFTIVFGALVAPPGLPQDFTPDFDRGCFHDSSAMRDKQCPLVQFCDFAASFALSKFLIFYPAQLDRSRSSSATAGEAENQHLSSVSGMIERLVIRLMEIAKLNCSSRGQHSDSSTLLPTRSSNVFWRLSSSIFRRDSFAD